MRKARDRDRHAMLIGGRKPIKYASCVVATAADNVTHRVTSPRERNSNFNDMSRQCFGYASETTILSQLLRHQVLLSKVTQDRSIVLWHGRAKDWELLSANVFLRYLQRVSRWRKGNASIRMGLACVAVELSKS